MRKIILSFAALCCIATASLAAVGDKVYFVDNHGIGAPLVCLYNGDWQWISAENCVEDGDLYGISVYSYTIPEEKAACAYIKFAKSDWSIQPDNQTALVNGQYYANFTWDAGTTYYTHPAYYNEFYFMDNNWVVFGCTPKIVLSTSEWEVLNDNGWDGQPMTSLGTITKGENTYAAYKYIYITNKAVEKIKFINGNGDDIENVSVDADKRVYAWSGWHTFSDVTNMQLVFANDKDGNDWSSMNMWWDNEAGLFKATRNDILVTVEGNYQYRILFSEGTWAARFPNTNAEGWNKSVQLTPGLYCLYYTYNPATDVATCNATATYSREVGAADKWGTICLPNPSTELRGAVFYTIAGKEGNNIILEEHEGNLEAGRPYLFKSTAAWVNVTLDASSYVDAWGNYNGLCGSYYEYAIDANGDNYLLYNGQFWQAEGDNAKVGKYRAYLKLSNIPTGTPAPGRHYVRMAINGENAATSVESNQQSAISSQKLIEDGQLLIIRGGVKYNVQGVIVK